ncbi:MAG: hypothetical protein ACJA2Q_001953 [Pseudohongiellaceae bacterium]|jgi:hypothetical protein
MLQEQIGASCPYCGEEIQLIIDCSLDHQEYIEDCQVCCRPILVIATVDEEGWPSLLLKAEDE